MIGHKRKISQFKHNRPPTPFNLFLAMNYQKIKENCKEGDIPYKTAKDRFEVWQESWNSYPDAAKLKLQQQADALMDIYEDHVNQHCKDNKVAYDTLGLDYEPVFYLQRNKATKKSKPNTFKDQNMPKRKSNFQFEFQNKRVAEYKKQYPEMEYKDRKQKATEDYHILKNEKPKKFDRFVKENMQKVNESLLRIAKYCEDKLSDKSLVKERKDYYNKEFDKVKNEYIRKFIRPKIQEDLKKSSDADLSEKQLTNQVKKTFDQLKRSKSGLYATYEKKFLNELKKVSLDYNVEYDSDSESD